MTAFDNNTSLPLKHLAIFDVDHTIGDIFDGWAAATDAAIAALAKSRGIDRDRIEAEMVNLDQRGHYLIHHFGEVLLHLPCLQPAPDQDIDFYEEIDARIVHDWLRMREQATRAYDGVFDTMAAIHAAGGRIALYTDSVMTPLLHRLWLMEVPMDLVDHIYCQPDVKVATTPPFLVDTPEWRFKKEVASKTTCLPKGSPKPNPDNMRRILADCGVAPDCAVMIGDHVNDGGSARGAGVDFAWQYQGVTVRNDTLALYDRLFAGFSYRIGVAAMQAQFTDANRPDIVLAAGVIDLLHHYRFGPPDCRGIAAQ